MRRRGKRLPEWGRGGRRVILSLRPTTNTEAKYGSEQRTIQQSFAAAHKKEPLRKAIARYAARDRFTFGQIANSPSYLEDVQNDTSNRGELDYATKHQITNLAHDIVRVVLHLHAHCSAARAPCPASAFARHLRGLVHCTGRPFFLIRCASVSIFQRSIAGSIIQYFAFGYRVFKYLVIYNILSSLMAYVENETSAPI